jgi:RNA polymerase sigma-70 factor (ECF subfamily)
MKLKEIHDQHADFVWRSLHRMGIRTEDATDLLQEVFVVVHRRLHTFDGTSKVETWLFGICLRVAAAHRRKAHVRREQPTDSIKERAHEQTPEAMLIAQDRSALLRSLLDTLDANHRVVLVMFEIEELSCAEISEELGIPVGTVYSRLHHARASLKQAWARTQAKNRGAA